MNHQKDKLFHLGAKILNILSLLDLELVLDTTATQFCSSVSDNLDMG
jgi:hypothetical protein